MVLSACVLHGKTYYDTGNTRKVVVAVSSVDGARLNHDHERQYLFVHQSLLLWREVPAAPAGRWRCVQKCVVRVFYGGVRSGVACTCLTGMRPGSEPRASDQTDLELPSSHGREPEKGADEPGQVIGRFRLLGYLRFRLAYFIVF